MINYHAFIIKPKGPFHIGAEGVGLEGTSYMLHSDTLFSALVHAWIQLDEKPLPDENWPVRLSSMLLVIAPPSKDDYHAPIKTDKFSECLYLFPRPLIDFSLCLPAGLKEQVDKKWKYARWVSLSILEMLRKGEILKEPDLAHNNEIVLTVAEKELFFPESRKFKELWKMGLDAARPRVTIDRMESKSQLYHIGCTYFSPRVGLFFLMQGDNYWKSKITRALSILGDSGIGGERTYGYGQFDFLGEYQFNFQDSNETNFLLLSLFHPRDGDDLKQPVKSPALYKVTERYGYFDSPKGRSFRRQRLLMLSEGSILSAQPEGAIPNVLPEQTKAIIDHPVYRYGKAFSLPGNYFLEKCL